ncbi:hypothetical protein KCA24_35720 [Escherichia coli]|nr:hypothetical protein [Escherichia coli]
MLIRENKPVGNIICPKTERSCNCFYDVPNGAVLNDENCMKLSPGSVLKWLKIDKARRYCQENKKKRKNYIGAFNH